MLEKILIVDDEAVILDLCRLLLENKGYPVVTAQSGAEALTVIRGEQPALVLLDYMMPEADGMTVLREIKADYADEIAVVMFTGKGSEAVAVEAMKVGAADYISKPFVNQALIERIENVLRIRRMEMLNRHLEGEQKRLQEEIQCWTLELEQRVAEKTRALEKAQQEIVQAEKLATVGHLVAGMAHEIRNPLNSISLFAQLLNGSLEENAELADYARKIIKEVERIDGTLLQLLAVGKPQQHSETRINVAEAIQQALDVFRDQMRSQGVELVLAVDDRCPFLKSDPCEIVQIFTNLFANALQAMPQGGVLKVALQADGDSLQIQVADSGWGIAHQDLARIFDPFFTTRQKGTGLGMSVVLRAVKNCGGTIRVESQSGQGTDVFLDFPLEQAGQVQEVAGGAA
ncbi:MAG: response regulator [Desulfuromonadaceae bacterium]|nr:response regulator [Desulfuromonadaceae bacterium]